jgi:hypothetical protein
VGGRHLAAATGGWRRGRCRWPSSEVGCAQDGAEGREDRIGNIQYTEVAKVAWKFLFTIGKELINKINNTKQ